jgi:hypothetical protein
MLNLLRCDCGNPECSHPTPTLYDWYSLAYCYYPRTVTVLEYTAKGFALLLAVLVLWAFIFVLFSLNVDPFYG